MSRKVDNRKMSVRCGSKAPSPYLRRHTGLLTAGLDLSSCLVVDLGCGNGRNSEYMKELGFKHVLSFDMRGDYGIPVELGSEHIPVPSSSADIILANYILMFFEGDKLQWVIREIKRIADTSGCKLMVELYPSQNSFWNTEEKIRALQRTVVDELGWKVVIESRGRFVAKGFWR
jgi:SAM-dependent methyltransferase